MTSSQSHHAPRYLFSLYFLDGVFQIHVLSLCLRFRGDHNFCLTEVLDMDLSVKNELTVALQEDSMKYGEHKQHEGFLTLQSLLAASTSSMRRGTDGTD